MNSLLSLLTHYGLSINARDANIPRVAADQAATDAIVGAVFIAAGAVTVLYILISGIRYIISQGNASQVAQAKDGILYGVAGLIIISLAFFIVQLVINVIKG
jgi:hypothetical protein